MSFFEDNEGTSRRYVLESLPLNISAYHRDRFFNGVFSDFGTTRPHPEKCVCTFVGAEKMFFGPLGLYMIELHIYVELLCIRSIHEAMNTFLDYS